MRYLSLCLMVAIAGCSRTVQFELYRDPAGFSLEAPKNWPRDADPAPAGKLAIRTEFIGEAQPQDEGVILGAVLSVTRLSRKAGDKMLASTKTLFADDAPTAAESKAFVRDYDHGGPTLLHRGSVAVPMHVEGKVFRTADAYFVVELRTVRTRFEKHRPSLERAFATFRPN